MLTRRDLGAAALASVALGGRSPFAFAQGAKHSLKLGGQFQASHPASVAMDEACAEIRKESSGQIDIRFFPNAQLGSDAAMLQQVRQGVLDMMTPMDVELHHPVPHDLNRDPAEPGCLGAGCPLIDRGQRQKAPRLRAVLRRAGDRAQRMGIKVCPERNRHGEPPSFATLNQTCLKPTRPNRVTPSGTWYNLPHL